MNYLLDSNIIIDYTRGFAPTIDFLSKNIDQDSYLSISVISEAEIYAGKSYGKLKDFLAEFPIDRLDVNLSIARLAGSLRREINSINLIDALIAATAINHNLTLITRNVKHFKNIPNLKLPNWQEEAC